MLLLVDVVQVRIFSAWVGRREARAEVLLL